MSGEEGNTREEEEIVYVCVFWSAWTVRQQQHLFHLSNRQKTAGVSPSPLQFGFPLVLSIIHLTPHTCVCWLSTGGTK